MAEKNTKLLLAILCLGGLRPRCLSLPGCGSSISLMEGRRCRYCDRELDLKGSDWIITDYQARPMTIKKK